MTGLTDLKKFRGQSWSAWTDFVGYRVPPELTAEHSDDHKNVKECQSMLLSRSDIPIFGHCPTAEVFELAVCNFCGDKFKIPALLEHIRNRHEDGQVLTTAEEPSIGTIHEGKLYVGSSTRNKTPRKSTSQRDVSNKLHKDKVKRRLGSRPSVTPMANGKCSDSSPPPPSPSQPSQMLQVQVQLDRTKLTCNEKVPNGKDVVRNDVLSTNHAHSQHSHATIHGQELKHIRMKLKKKQVRQGDLIIKENDTQVVSSGTNVLLPSIPVRISQSQCFTGQSRFSVGSNDQNKSVNSSQIGGSNGHNYSKNKDKSKEGSDHQLQRKNSSRQSTANSSHIVSSETLKPGDNSACQPTALKELSEHCGQDKTTSETLPELPSLTTPQRKVTQQASAFKEDRKKHQPQKTTERRVGVGCTVRDRTYNPDKHCGVITKENSRPCTRSLTCKTHSISLRRAVKGRSKTFDMLLADHRKDKEMSRCSTAELNNTSILTSATTFQQKKTVQPALVETKSESQDEQSIHVNRTCNSNSKVIAAFTTSADTPTSIVESTSHILSLPVSIKPQDITAPSKLHTKTNLDEAEPTIIPIDTSVHSSTTVLPLISPSFSTVDNHLSSNNTDPSQYVEPAKAKDASEQHQFSQKNYQLDGYQQWHPMWRRNRGLLYTSVSQNPRVPSAMSINMSSSWNVTPTAVVQQSQVPPSCLLQAVEQCTKALLAASNVPARPSLYISYSSPSTVSSLPLVPLDDAGNSSKRTMPTASNSIANVASKKMRTQRGQVSVLGPLATETTQTQQGRPVVQVSINSIIGRNFMPASGPPSHQIVSAIPGSTPTINLLPSTPVSLGPPRIHYISASGPIPLTLQQVAIVPQVI